VVEHLEELAGLKVVDWVTGKKLVEPESHAFRIAVEYEPEEPWLDVFDGFLSQPGVEKVKGLIVGNWGEVASGDGPEPIVEALVGARTRLTSIEALFIADLVSEESEISWIHQGDLSPLLSAYPALKVLGIRGANGLSLGRLDHPKLERLVIESGGLGRGVVQQIMSAQLPSLTHLELWLGDDGYGADTSPEDFAPLLDGSLFPKLQTLGLRNCHYADALAKVVATAPILSRISTLDLSLGVLMDEGAQALLDSPLVRRLKKLDLHHHFISEELAKKLAALPLEVDVSDAQEGDEHGGEVYRYVAVSE